VTFANERGGKDNLSAILLQDESLAPTPVDGTPATRDVDAEADGPVEQRETVILPDE